MANARYGGKISRRKTADVQTASEQSMTKLRKKKSRKKETPGPKPDMLKIEGDWKDAVKKSLQKKKPAQGWPK
jgi:hypothetical protein